MRSDTDDAEGKECPARTVTLIGHGRHARPYAALPAHLGLRHRTLRADGTVLDEGGPEEDDELRRSTSTWLTQETGFPLAATLESWKRQVSRSLQLATSSRAPSRKPSVPRRDSTTVDTLGFSFSPAGLLLPYHFGVLHTLQDYQFVTDKTCLAGASAGAIAICCAACKIDMSKMQETLSRVNNDILQNGAPYRLHALMEDELAAVLPEDAHEVLNARPGEVIVSHTSLWPYPKGQFISKFKDKKDLMDCLFASCNIPFYFSRWPTLTCRGKPCVDGYFAVPRKHFGCPKTGAKHTIRVMPFPEGDVRISFPRGHCISPELQKFDRLLENDPQARAEFARLLAPSCQDPQTPAVRQRDSSEESTNGLQASPTRSVEEEDVGCASPALSDIEDEIQEELRRTFPPPRSEEVAASSEAHDTPTSGPEPPTGSQWNPFLSMLQSAVSTAAPKRSRPDPLPGAPSLQWDVTELLRIALEASSEEKLRDVYRLGRADALRWILLRRLEEKERNAPQV